MSQTPLSYRDAGVDIDAAEAAKRRIAALARGTFNAGVLTEIGSFGGMFRPDLAGFRDPVLVASADGVGTKLHVANQVGVHDTVGYDLVAHCVNDILVQGAVPLFFLDYIALGSMDTAKVEAVVSGLARACREFGCPLLGGETAQMPGTYASDDYDLAGFIVGVVDRGRALTGARVREGDVLLGLPSAGLHTNGYSLARKVLLETMGLTVPIGIRCRPLPIVPARAVLNWQRPSLLSEVSTQSRRRSVDWLIIFVHQFDRERILGLLFFIRCESDAGQRASRQYEAKHHMGFGKHGNSRRRFEKKFGKMCFPV